MKVTWDQIKRAIVKFETRPEALTFFLREVFSDRQNILLFAKYFFPHYTQVESPPFHQELNDLLDAPGNGGIAAPRGHAKTTQASIVYAAWLCVYKKEHFILVGSETYSLATSNVNALKAELGENKRLEIVYGTQTSRYWKDGEFITSGDVMVKAISYEGKIRGIKHKQWRPSLILLDDLENDENVRSAEQRLYMRDWITKAALPALAKGGRMKIIGTILHSDSLLENIIMGNDEFASWKQNSKKFKALNDGPDGEYSLWPALYSVEELKRMRDDPSYEHYKGSLAFSQEMQNEPMADEDRIYKLPWIDDHAYTLQAKLQEWENAHPEEASKGETWITNELRIYGGIDPAISEKTRADFWVFFTIGVDKKGEIWMLDVVRIKTGDVEKQAQIVIDGYKLWKHDKIKGESVAFQAGLTNLIRKLGALQGVYPPIFPVVPDKDKTRRGVMHSANFSGGLVHLRKDHPLYNVVREEFLQFPRGTHDDIVDGYMFAAEDFIKRTVGRVFKKKPRGF